MMALVTDEWLSKVFGPDWQAYAVYAGALLILIIVLGYGFWKGNGK